MCKSHRNPGLPPVFTREPHGVPAPKGWRLTPQIKKNIEHLPAHYTDQFALRLLNLVMQASQDAAFRVRMIILDESLPNAKIGENSLAITLEEKSALVFKDLRFKYERAGERSFENVHFAVVRIR